MKKTRKVVKVIGTQEYINKETGQVEEMQVMRIEERDANFHKLWLGHILQTIDLIGNQKTRLAFWILDHLNGANQLIMTQRKMSEETGISLATVNLTLQALIDSNFLKVVQNGVYQVNPDILFKGGKTDRMNILLEYRNQEERNELINIRKDDENEYKTVEKWAEKHGQVKLPFEEIQNAKNAI